MKLTYKSGWIVFEITGINFQPTGKFETYHFLDDVCPPSLTVPAKVGDFEISEAHVVGIEDYDKIIDSVIIEQPMDRVRINGFVKEITIPLSDKSFVEIEGNTALETINFGGTMQEWEELYGYKAQEWIHIYDHYDEEQGKSVYVDITFTVHCTNGDITYPKTNA